jgi:SAM-dependent methyltransferase
MNADNLDLKHIIQEMTGESINDIDSKIAMGTELSKEKRARFLKEGGTDAKFQQESDSFIYELVNWENDPMKKQLINLLSYRFPKHIPILDFGCGIGSIINSLYEAGFISIDGIDPNCHNRRFCETRFRGRKDADTMIYGSFEQTRRAEYGIILCLHALKQSAATVNALKKIRTKMMPGGVFFGVAPYGLVGDEASEQKPGWSDFELFRVCGDAGLKIVSMAPFGNINGCAFELVIAQYLE